MRQLALHVCLGWILVGCGEDAAPDSMLAMPLEDAGVMTSDVGGAIDGSLDVDGSSRPTDATAPVDAMIQTDAAPSSPDGGPMMADQGMTPAEETTPTWVDCHLAARADALEPMMEDQCDALHTAPPERRIYGVRFVFLSEAGDLMDWIQPRLDVANEIFEPAGLSFTTVAVVEVVDGEVEYLTGSQALSLGERLGDLRGHLELPDADINTLLEALRERLSRSGAAAETVADLSADTVFTDQLFMRLMARAHPEDIYVAVGDVSERPGAGGQAPPPFHPIATLERSVVSLRASTKNTVAAHELGHYFGLKHPHSHSAGAGGPNAHLFGAQRVQNRYRASETHQLMPVLDEHFGPDLSGPLGTPYVPYDATAEDIADFEALRFALMDTWVRWRVTYSDERDPFASYAAFIQAWRDGNQIGLSNYMVIENERQINNCTWQAASRSFSCSYPGLETGVNGGAPLLDGFILFDEGRKSNVMSYIRISGQNSPPTNFGLFQEQLDVIQVSANAPQRLALRNYADESDR